MPPKGKKPLQVTDIPFYQAVSFFEKDNIADSFPIFIDCARHGNLYASHYINHILLTMPTALEGLTLTPEQRDFIEPQHFSPYFAALPDNFMPKAWLETSLIKREFSKKIWFEKSKEQKVIHLSRLMELADWCGNAYVYLSTLIRTNQEIATLIEKNIKTIGFHNLQSPKLIDLFMVIHDELYNQDPPPKSHACAKMLWPVVDKQAFIEEQKVATEYAMLAKTGGSLEEIIYKKLYDPLYNSSSKKSSGRSRHKKVADVPKLNRLAKWYLAAANMGNSYVQMLMARQYVQSEVDQGKWVAIAARHGDLRAQLVMGIKCVSQGDWERAFNMFEVIPANLDISRLQGNKQIPESLLKHAICAKAELFERGPQTRRDEREALRHYQLAARLSFPGALYNIAVYYEQGRGGLEKDYKKAIENFLSCYELDKDPVILEYIAELYFHGGFGIDQDYQQAEYYYRKYLKTGATFKSAESYGNLASIVFSRGNPKYYDQAISYCKQALKMDPKNDYVRRVLINNYCLGKISKSLDINDDTIDAMVQAVFVRFPEVLNNLVEYYYSGKGSSKKNSKKMVQFARLGHENNLDYCTAVLGYCYEQGVKDADVEQDDSQAVLYYKKAASTQTLAACNLGFLLTEGRGEKSDFKQAKEYLESALGGGSLMAAYNLWHWYIRHGSRVLGIGQSKAEKRGFAVLIQAEELEDADVQYSIGYAYHVGMGCEEDWSKALRFYERAISLGFGIVSGAACINSASIIFTDCLKKGGVSHDVLERCIELSKKSIELSGHFSLAGGQFFLGMFQMILDPNQKNKVMRNWKELLKHQKDIVESEDNKAFSDRMRCILNLMEVERGQPSQLKVMLWFSKKIFDLKSLQEELRVWLAKEKVGRMTERWRSSDQDTQIDHLLTRIDEFTSQSPSKIDFGDFRELVNKVVSSNIGLVSLTMRHSKSSNVQMRFLVEGSEKPITLSHHKARFQDPGRGKSMQHVMSAVKRDLVAMQQETSENLEHPGLFEETENQACLRYDVKRGAEDEEVLMPMEASMTNNRVPDEFVSPKIKPHSQDLPQQLPSEPTVKPLIFSGEQATNKKKQSLTSYKPKKELTKEEWEAILSVTWTSIKPGTVKTTEDMTYIEADNLKEKLVKAGLDRGVMTVTRDLRSSKYQVEIPQQEQEKLDTLYRESTVGQRFQRG